MDRSRILVTGGAGMIGSNLVRQLVAMGHHVEVADNLWRGRLAFLEDQATGRPVIDLGNCFHHLDLALPGSLDRIIERFDYVCHLADIVGGIGYVFSNQGEIFRQNILINSNVVSACRRHRALKGYLYVGTACSFPAFKQTGLDAPPLKEEDQYPAWPESAYGWSKLMGEYEAQLMRAEAGIPTAVVILHNVYGVPCDFDPSRSQVIPALVRKAIRYPEEEFIVWGTGKQGRAFVHVDDVVDGLVAALTLGLDRGPIQLGPDRCTSIREIAETVVEISGKDIQIHYDASKPEGDKGRCADYGKARRVLDWEPRVPLRRGLVDLYGWIEAGMRKDRRAAAA